VIVLASLLMSVTYLELQFYGFAIVAVLPALLPNPFKMFLAPLTLLIPYELLGFDGAGGSVRR
jgi:hypothetical protein